MSLEPEIASNKDNNYPNWPPPIPTHPPNHAAPTHPAISGSLPGGTFNPITTKKPLTTSRRPPSTWPTKKPTSPQWPNWPPSIPIHPTFTTTESSLDNENDIPIDGSSCGAKNGFPVNIIMISLNDFLIKSCHKT